MKKYQLNAMINGNEYINKNFRTRKDADRYLNKILANKDLQVTDTYFVAGNKHNVEFVCDDYTRINIKRA